MLFHSEEVLRHCAGGLGILRGNSFGFAGLVSRK